jgi:hypothetical protein
MHQSSVNRLPAIPSEQIMKRQQAQSHHITPDVSEYCSLYLTITDNYRWVYLQGSIHI